MKIRKYFPIIFCSFIFISSLSTMILVSNTNSSSPQPQYYDLVKNTFSLTPAELNLLEKNKFVVLNRMGTEDILDAYKFYWDEDLPIFITTDTMLHTWHLIFDQTLENLEEKIFYPLLNKLGENLISIALTKYNDDLLRADTFIYFLVASKLANSTYNEEIPPDIKIATEKILSAIRDEIGLDQAIAQFNTEFTQRFIDDFSQYKPRGHYTHSENLEKYFRLYKWFSRIPFFFDDYAGEFYLGTSPQEMIRSSLEVTWLLKETTVECFENLVTGLEIWNIFKLFLDAIVGKTNSISPQIIDGICKDLRGDFWNIEDIDDNLISQIQDEVLNDSTIPEPKIPYIIDARAGGFCSPKTFVLFGERLTLDSYALQNLVYPYVSTRLLPTSLDFATACLESERSIELLEPEFEKYPELLGRILEMRRELKNITGVEKQTIHWQWIESLKKIAVTEPECNGSIVIPNFMISSAWLDEKLTTIMGSWSQLKHDTILYAKQSITPGLCSTPTGYVEPYPEFYRKLRELSQLYDSSIIPLKTIGYDFSDYDYYYLRALGEFSNATLVLETIAYKELKGIELSDEEKEFIETTYAENHMCGGPFVEGWLAKIIGKLSRAYGKLDDFPNSRASLVADIHTDTNTGDILHLATGLLEPIIAYVPGWDNQEITVVGPVFSFYEFVLPKYQRLNDPEWRGILALRLDKENTKNYDYGMFPRGFWAESYMTSTKMTTSRILIDEEEFDPPDWFVGEEKDGLEQFTSTSFFISSILLVGLISVLIVVIKKRNLIKSSR